MGSCCLAQKNNTNKKVITVDISSNDISSHTKTSDVAGTEVSSIAQQTPPKKTSGPIFNKLQKKTEREMQEASLHFHQ